MSSEYATTTRKLISYDIICSATIERYLCGLYKAQGRYNKAKEVLRGTMEDFALALRRDNESALTVVRDLVEMLREQGKVDRAKEVYL
ncbi:hypothetical protein QQS21_001928 [Conoideocrella luteorostrata]|uniref:Tetratricopeptide repeat protein n=1 Tax=Conoideocrella luteorostrata TaxID=1105319 RepID=A0AAJ0CYQ6_9HYPO|nr:hypothetical protein QQS21_001928 [Conoideocrella luteorostrata]